MSSRGTRYWSSGSIPLIGPDVLGDIIATASDLAVVISDTGQVLSVIVNPTHRSFGDLGHWEGRDVRDFLTKESIPKLESQLQAFYANEPPTRAMELNHSDRGDWEFPVRYTLHKIGPDGALLMLGRDLRPIAEMQEQLVNAQMALERDYETQREYDTRFRVLLEGTREAAVFLSAESGRISELNSAAAAALGASVPELTGSNFAHHFDGGEKSDLIEALSASALSDQSKPVDAVSRRTGAKVSLVPTAFRAAGERILMCRIDAGGDRNRAPDELSDNLAGLYREGTDAIVFTDRDAGITAANEAFLNLVDISHTSRARGRSLADFLSRGSVDTKVLIDNALRSGHMSLYASKLVSEFGSETSVEISVTALNDRAHPVFAFVIRDASRTDALRRPVASGSDDGMRSVMELVGAASLKEIVADTTDVIEKMCIETAVELTRNNRVAAAEMLGLSRQSLYVKLRKYGLLSKDSS